MKKLIVILSVLISASPLIAVTIENRTGKDLIARAYVGDSVIGSDTGSYSDIIIYADGTYAQRKEMIQSLSAASINIRYLDDMDGASVNIDNVQKNDHIIVRRGRDTSTLAIQLK